MEPVITGIVALVSAYMAYRASIATAQAAAQPAPSISKEIAAGERALTLVREAVVQGTEDHQHDLASFERNPERNKDQLTRTLGELVQAQPDLLAQFQTLLHDANVQVGGVHGTVHVSGGTVHGPIAGVNTGTITYTAGSIPPKGGK
jgi:hypothetical protein